jgi:hypothetical protein
VAAIALAACTSPRPRKGEASSASPPEVETAAAAEPPPPAPRKRWRERTDFDCDRARLQELAKAARAVVAAPATIPRELDDAFPTARAYRAYAALVAGKPDEVRLRFEDAVVELAGDVAAQRRAGNGSPAGAWIDGLVRHPDASPLARVLRLVRLSGEDLDGYCRARWSAAHPAPSEVFADLPPVFSCKLFERHPREATDALRPLHGDANDTSAFARREECAAELLNEAAPAAEARAALAAMAKVERAVLDAGRRSPADPYALEEYVTRSHAVRALIQDEVLAPGLLQRDVPAADALAASLDKASRRTLGQVAAFKKVLAAEAPALATGICAVAAARHRAMTPDRCADRARDAATYALADWLAAGE